MRFAHSLESEEGRSMTKKSARPSKAESGTTRKGAEIIAPGFFPVKQSSVCADVLARLLGHQRLTSLDAVTESSTTRLAAVVHYLAKSLGWHIESIDKAAGCRDGRVAWVSEYFLPAETIELAAAAGSGQWCAKVRAERALLRAKAAQARRDAKRLNAMRTRHAPPNQGRLFDGEI